MTDQQAGLAGKLKRGATAATGGLAVVQVVSIAQTLVLGRILGPTEVGIFAAGTVLLGFFGVVSQGAIAQALIQRRTDIETAANTALRVSIATGLLLGLLLTAISPVIGSVFGNDRVALIAAASGGIVILQTCTNVPDALMQRALKFYRRIIIDPIVAVTYAAVAIGFALAGFGAWSLVIGTYSAQVVWVILSWWLARWRPTRGSFSFRVWRELATFSFPVLVDSMAERIREAAEQIIIGRFLGTMMLGQFRYGFRLGSMPSLAIIQVGSFVLFPAFAQIAEDRVRFAKAYLRAMGWLWFAAFPVGLLMILGAEPVVTVLLGEEWRPAGAAAAAMAGIGPGIALAAVAGEAIKGIGRPRLLAWLALISLGVGIPLVLVMVQFGLSAVGLAISVSYLLVGVLSVLLAGPVLEVRVSAVLRLLIPITVAALIPFAAVVAGRLLWNGGVGLIQVIVECIGFGVVYLIMLMILDRDRAGALAGGLRAVIGRYRSRANRDG